MQYVYEFVMGRIGASLCVYAIDKGGFTVYRWDSRFNGRGIDMRREDRDGNSVIICEFDTLHQPDKVEEDELHLIDMLSGQPVEEDHKVIKLCSLLVAKWIDGHTEESFHEVIMSTLKLWESGKLK